MRWHDMQECARYGIVKRLSKHIHSCVSQRSIFACISSVQEKICWNFNLFPLTIPAINWRCFLIGLLYSAKTCVIKEWKELLLACYNTRPHVCWQGYDKLDNSINGLTAASHNIEKMPVDKKKELEYHTFDGCLN